MSKRRGSYFGSSTIIKGSTEERRARAKCLDERMRKPWRVVA
jgi:hypothetical protein